VRKLSKTQSANGHSVFSAITAGFRLRDFMLGVKRIDIRQQRYVVPFDVALATS
jgi:hypothetical protein